MSGEPQRVAATASHVGRNCPYCRFPLKEGGDLILCGQCHAAHHADCWDENHGCAVLGCDGAPTVITSPGATIRMAAPAAAGAAATGGFQTAHAPPPVIPPPAAAPPQGAVPPPPPPQTARQSHTPWILLGVVLLACAIGAGLYVGGVFKHHTNGQPTSFKQPSGRNQSNAPATNQTITQTVTVAQNTPTTSTQTASTTAAPTQADQNAIVNLLNNYVSAWQNTSPSSLTPLLTANVVRIGSVSGSCGTTIGRANVVNLYASSEMSSATTDYQLLNTNPDIVFATPTTATVDETYAFGSEQPHFVNFTFTKQNGRWLISKLHAWCHA